MIHFIIVMLLVGVKGQNILGIEAANLETFNEFSFCNYSVNGQHTLITNLTTVGGVLPQTAAAIPNYGLFFLSIGLDGFEYATIIKIGGTISFHKGFLNQVLTNAAYDQLTRQYFINSYDSILSENYLTELFPLDGTLTQLVKIPGIVQVDISAYSSKEHIFFLTLQNDDGGNSLIRVDTQNKKILSSVVVPDGIEILIWDDTEGVLYAWVADETYAGVLVILDITTGMRVKTIVEYLNYSANGGTSILFESHKIVYASLIDISNGDQLPVWVTVDLTTGKATAHPTDLNLGFPINLVTI